MHGPAKVFSQTGRVVRLLHGRLYKTRHASDVELVTAPEPAPPQATTPGLVGAARSARRLATGPSASGVAGEPPALHPPFVVRPVLCTGSQPMEISPEGRLEAVTAVSRVFEGAVALGRSSTVPGTDMSVG